MRAAESWRNLIRSRRNDSRFSTRAAGSCPRLCAAAARTWTAFRLEILERSIAVESATSTNFLVARRFGGEGAVDVPGCASSHTSSSVSGRRLDADAADVLGSASSAVLDGLLELELEASWKLSSASWR